MPRKLQQSAYGVSVAKARWRPYTGGKCAANVVEHLYPWSYIFEGALPEFRTST
jgi:hypothetical protein